MVFHFPEKMRNNIIPNITKWFKNIMEINEAIKAYGRTILCTLPLKPFIQKINENKSPNITDNFVEKISFENIKSNYILNKVFNFLREKKLFDIIHYNKYLQKKLNKDINDFKEFLKIEIEIITSDDDKKFINYAE